MAFKSSKVQALKVFGLVSVLTFGLLNLLNLERASAQTPYYQGKQIRLIIGSTPGGGYDLWPRAAARYLTKHIPGNPDIVAAEHARRWRYRRGQLSLTASPSPTASLSALSIPRCTSTSSSSATK